MTTNKRLIFVGPPGAGKGTASAYISNKLSIPAISTGDIFRKEIKQETELGKLAASLINKGNFVPDDIVVNIIQNTLKTIDSYILDGFPRNLAQAEIFDTMLSESGQSVDAVIHMDIEHDIIVERLSHRRVCTKCDATYHLVTKPPVKEDTCDKCHSPLKQREDDESSKILHRLNIYHSSTEPIIDFYEKKGLVYYIQADCKMEDMFAQIDLFLEKL